MRRLRKRRPLMPAIDLTDGELRLLAKLAETALAPDLAKKLRASTFEARGLHTKPEPSLVHVARADK